MEQTGRRLQIKVNEYEKAVSGLEKLLNVDLLLYPDEVSDGLRNGQIQKFEYICEMSWKLVRLFLIEAEGTDAKSPKSVFRELFQIGMIDEKEFEKWMEIIENRNNMSHMYNEKVFDEILNQLPFYLKEFNNLLGKIKSGLLKSGLSKQG